MLEACEAELQSLEPPGEPLSKGEIHAIEPKPAARLEEMPRSKSNLTVEPVKELEQDQ
jgi:hypothetical protein